MSGGFGRVVKRKRELEKHGAEFAGFAENVEAGADAALVFGCGGGLGGEALPEFGGDEESGICRDTFDPAGGVFRVNWLIKRRVDLEGVEKIRAECCFVKVFWS